MRLYYMSKLETVENFILPELRIKLSTFDMVNDPFELLGMRQEDKRSRRRFQLIYRHWVDSRGFISFSDNWKSPLMWGHYADNHTGVCLGIEIDEQHLWQVNYQQNKLDALLNMSQKEMALSESLFKQIVTTKFSDWSYECEWRHMKELQHQDPDTGFYYEEFSPKFELREIIIGARCPRKLNRIREQVFANTGTVKVSKVRPAFQNFSMVKQRLHKELTIQPFHKVKGFNNY